MVSENNEKTPVVSKAVEYADHRIFQRFRRERLVGYIFGVLCLAFAIVMMVSHSENLKHRGSVFVSQADGTIEFGNLRELDPESLIFEQLAEIATEVIFQRNPEGLQKEHWVGLLFTNSARDKLMLDVKEQKPELANKNMHQHPEIRNFQYLHSSSGETLAYRVDGQLVRNATFQGSAIPEPTVAFRLVLGFQRNPDIITSKQWPYRVVAFDYRIFTTN